MITTIEKHNFMHVWTETDGTFGCWYSDNNLRKGWGYAYTQQEAIDKAKFQLEKIRFEAKAKLNHVFAEFLFKTQAVHVTKDEIGQYCIDYGKFLLGENQETKL